MKIEFEEDSSFLEFIPNDSKLSIIMCGKKSFREVTMSAADLYEAQVDEIIEFLLAWKNKK